MHNKINWGNVNRVQQFLTLNIYFVVISCMRSVAPRMRFKLKIVIMRKNCGPIDNNTFAVHHQSSELFVQKAILLK